MADSSERRSRIERLVRGVNTARKTHSRARNVRRAWVWFAGILAALVVGVVLLSGGDDDEDDDYDSMGYSVVSVG